MLIRRCAWHRVYRGYPIVYGVAGWRLRGVHYTDGMCRRCAGTALKEWTTGRPMAPPPRIARRLLTSAGGKGIAIAAVTTLVVLGVVAMARRDTVRNTVTALSRAATGTALGHPA